MRRLELIFLYLASGGGCCRWLDEHSTYLQSELDVPLTPHTERGLRARARSETNAGAKDQSRTACTWGRQKRLAWPRHLEPEPDPPSNGSGDLAAFAEFIDSWIVKNANDQQRATMRGRL